MLRRMESKFPFINGKRSHGQSIFKGTISTSYWRPNLKLFLFFKLFSTFSFSFFIFTFCFLFSQRCPKCISLTQCFRFLKNKIILEKVFIVCCTGCPTKHDSPWIVLNVFLQFIWKKCLLHVVQGVPRNMTVHK